MKNLLIAAALALASLTAVACSPTENNRPATTSATSGIVLDGKTYAVDAPLPDGSKVSTDLSFANGELTSSACTKIGFGGGRYSVTREGNVLAFRAEMKKGSDVEVWTGRIDGDSVEGTVTGPDGKSAAYRGRATK